MSLKFKIEHTIRIKMFYASLSFSSMFITHKGAVYACGWNADGQTGQNNYESNWEPKQVTGDIVGEDIVKLSCAADCVLALNSKYCSLLLPQISAK